MGRGDKKTKKEKLSRVLLAKADLQEPRKQLPRKKANS